MTRESCVTLLEKHLEQAGGTNCHALAAEIEASIFAQHNDNNDAYKADIRSKSSNLKTNPQFAHDLLEGRLDPKTVGLMTIEDMASQERKQENAELKQEAIEESIGVNTMQPSDDVADGELETGIALHTGQKGLEYETSL